MELSMGVIVTLVIILVAALVFITMILGWSGDAKVWFNSTVSPFDNMLQGKSIPDQNSAP